MNGVEIKVLKESKSLFKKYGFKNVTMDDISRELGMSKKTIYLYFKNKKELVSKSIDLYIKEEGNCVCAMADQNKNAIEEMFILADHVRQVFKEIGTNTMYELNKYYKEAYIKLHNFLTIHIYDSITQNLNKGIKEGLYKENIPVGIIARFYVSKAQSIKDESIFPQDRFPKDLVVDTLIEYHLRAIISKKGEKLVNQYLNEN